MAYKDVIIDREELYDQVWSTPMSRLACQYQMSDVGLAKICKKMEVPRPGRGYWAKIQSGMNPKRTKLGKLSKRGRAKTMIRLNDAPKKEEKPVNPVVEKLKQAPKAKVSKTLNSPHPLVEKAQKFLSHTKIGERGLLIPNQVHCLDIRVSEENTSRILCIYDTIIKNLEALNYKVQIVKHDKGSYTHASIKGKQVRFYIEEKCRRIDHVWTEKELEIKRQVKDASIPRMRRKYTEWDLHCIPKYDSKPTGLLSVVIREPGSYMERRWNDGKVKRLEDSINDVVAGLIEEADRYIAKDEEDKRRKEEWDRQQIRDRKLRGLKEEEQKRIDALFEKSDKWHKSKELREYLLAVEKSYKNQSPTQEQLDWLKWAKNYADYIDPLTKSEYKEPALED